MHNKILTGTKQNLLKRKLLFIDMFDHTGPDVVCAMRNLTVGVFEHLYITSYMYVDQRVAYMKRILIVSALNKYNMVLAECKESEKGLSRGQWTIVPTKYVTMEQLWTWAKTDANYCLGDVYLGRKRCIHFEKGIWFELGKRMWKRHWSIYQDRVKYTHNEIVKPFRVRILQDSKRIRDMHNLANYFPSPLMKGGGFESAYWDVCSK